MMQEKLVSVCVNAYNAEKYIAKTLDSICGQTYKNLQIIVVDDCSTDNTAKIVEGFEDGRIELYRLERNGHISNANNQAYSHIKGEYMVHCDADDIMEPNLIEKAVGFLEANAEYGACFCQMKVIDQNGNSASEEFSWLEDIFRVDARSQADFIRLFFDLSNHLLHSGATIRSGVIREIGSHNLSMCYLHDFDYWVRLIRKYPINVIQEPLIQYRMDTSGEHNSDMNHAKTLAHDNEYARIIYSMIDNCPDDLFLEAFADRLILSGEHTHKEVELEKAFLLKRGLRLLPENHILSILKFSQLFKDDEYVDLAREKFNFTVRDLYKLQSCEVFHNKAEAERVYDVIETQKNSIDMLNDMVAQKLKELEESYAEIHNRDHTINQLNSDLERSFAEIHNCNLTINRLNSDLEQSRTETHNCNLNIMQMQTEIANINNLLAHKQKLLNRTVEYNIARVLKKAYKLLKVLKHFLCLTDRHGKKYRKSIMLYGFYDANLGDDLFFEKLIRRYPDTMFLVYVTPNYRSFFEKFDNVKFFDVTEARVQKINRIGQKFKIRDLFERLLLARSSATVHIGGSIYQQIGEWELDFKLRECRKRPFKPFYSITCNFGAYKTEEYRKMWGRKFVKFKDICFRDRYSYNLFSDIKNVRYAPDLMFSYEKRGIEQIDGSVAISIINPIAAFRDFPQEFCLAYQDSLVATVNDLIKDNRKVAILGFCPFEGDADYINHLLSLLSHEARQKTEVINYTFDAKDAVLNAMESAEYIIGTRLHSVILGLRMGKKVLPIVYNPKTQNILDDIEYNGLTVTAEDIGSYAEKGFVSALCELEHFDASQYGNSEELQFARLDKFLK